MRPSKYKELNTGICLHYLIYVLIAGKKSIEEMFSYLEHFSIGPSQTRNALAAKLVSLYSKATSV